MFSKKCKKVLIVSADNAINKLMNFPESSNTCSICNISNPAKIFTSLYEGKPDIIIFDHDFLKKDVHNILRRIKANAFYDSIKVCCYRTEADQKADDLLKALGVEQMIYKTQLESKTTNIAVEFKSDNILRLLSLNLAFK